MAREMKYSGFAWIGDIPLDWEVRKVKHYYKTQTGFTPDTKNENYYDEISGFDWVNISDISNGQTIRETKKKVSQEYIDLYAPNIIPENSLLYSFKLSVGQTAFAGKPLYSNEAIASFLPDKSVCLRYLRYSSVFIIENAQTNIYNAKILNQDLIKNAYIVFPPLDEQKLIADFLDEKCAAIDSAVEKTRESIEEYKKLKQAVITEAVTKGIRGNYSNQMSDNAWFSEIPSNWEIRKLKYLFSIKKNIAGKEGYTVLSITQKGIVPKNILKNEGQLAQDYSNYQLVEIGDFAMNHMDLLTGWVDISKYDGVTSPDYRVFILNDNENNSPEYYLRFMQMCYFNKIFYGLGQGVSGLGRWRLQADKFLNFVVPVPPVEEQLEIAEYLDVKCTEIDNIVSKKEQYLVELEAYKKSLIYEYVTGKKEVIEDVQVEEAVDYPYFPAKYNAKSSRFAQAILMSKILDENCDNMGRVKLEKNIIYY